MAFGSYINNNLIYQNPYLNLKPISWQTMGLPGIDPNYSYSGTGVPPLTLESYLKASQLEPSAINTPLRAVGMAPAGYTYSDPNYIYSGKTLYDQFQGMTPQQILGQLSTSGIPLLEQQRIAYYSPNQQQPGIGSPSTSLAQGNTGGPAQLSPYDQTLQDILKLLSGGNVNPGTTGGTPQKYAYQLDQLNPFVYGNLTGLGLPEQTSLYSSLGGRTNLYNLIGGR